MKKTSRNRIYNIFLIVAVTLLGILMVIFPTDSSLSAQKGLNICLNVLIPSLFPFMVITVFLTESGFSKYIFYLPSVILRKFTGLNEQYCNLFFIGQIGGYPSAAKNISVCVKNGEIDTKTAEILLCFCTNAGPSFLITAVGSRMFLSAEIGIILYISSVLSSLSMLLVYSHKIKSAPKSSLKIKKKSSSNALVYAVKTCCNSMSMICALVLVFSVMVSFLEKYMPNLPNIKAILCGLLEVTSGCISAAYDISFGNVMIVSAICAFGGLCVILQIKSILSEYNISIKRFVLSRLLNILFNLIYTFLLLFSIPINYNQTFISNTSSASPDILTSPVPSLMLLLCCVCLPLCLTKRKKM